jgi:hypothetical protein
MDDDKIKTSIFDPKFKSELTADIYNPKITSDLKIDGNLVISGTIHADKIIMTETQVILNIDYDKITEYMRNMDSEGLKFFSKHLERLKLMAEKELLDRS